MEESRPAAMEDGVPPADPAGGNLREGRIVACVALAAFLFQFEAFVVNVSLPTIAREFGTTTTFVSFVVIAYLLGTTTALLPAGRLGDRLGLAPVFLAGCALSALGTLGSGLAVNLGMLCASRLIQGLGAGAMVAMGYAMIPAWLAPHRTGWGYGRISLGAGLGMVAGLPVGGLVSHAASWRWIFLVTLPVMLLLLVAAARALPRARPESPPPHGLDLGGTLLFAATLAAMIMAVSLGAELGWRSPAIVGLAVAAAALAAVAAIRTRLTGRAYLPREAFRSPGFAVGVAVLLVFAAATSGIGFLVPFYLQGPCGLTSFWSSVLLMAYPLSYAPVGAWSGRWADRVGSRSLVVAAGLLAALAAVAFGASLQRSELWMPVVFLLAAGTASGLFFAPNNRYVMTRGPAAGSGEAGAVLPLALNLGSMLGVAVFETAFSQMLPEGIAPMAEIFAAGGDGRLTVDRAFGNAFALAGVGFLLCAAAAGLAYRGSRSPPG